MKIRKGDTVYIISGADRGKTGKVLKVYPRLHRVLVEGVNIVRKRQRPRREGQKGQVLEMPMPIHVSNVQLIDPKTNKPTRVGRVQKGDRWVRVSKKSGAEM